MAMTYLQSVCPFIGWPDKFSIVPLAIKVVEGRHSKQVVINSNDFGVLLEYPTTTCFQLGHLKNSPYTYTVSRGNGRVF